MQDENTRLKKLVADLSLDKAFLHDINQKNCLARVEAPGGELLDGSLPAESVELPPSDRTVGCRLMEAADELTG